jgi:predicted phage terminase large subunit-like protein
VQDGVGVHIYMEQEPGSSGVALMDHYRRNVLAGYYVKPSRPNRDKVTRATPMSSAAEAGYITLVQAGWNAAFMDECSLFPNSDHDDMVDAAAGAFAVLARRHGSRIIL